MGDYLVTEEFELNRSRLRAVALRLLGSASEADDAVQETWLRLNRVQAREIDNLEAWLTTVVGRICLDMLRSRTARREEPLVSAAESGADPEQEALLADSIGSALLVVLATLTPAERLAFVLHDMFAVSFEEIAVIVGRSPAATRQLASRARSRLQTGSPIPSAAASSPIPSAAASSPVPSGAASVPVPSGAASVPIPSGAASVPIPSAVASVPIPSAIASRRHEIVAAFLAASREGDLVTLLTLLDPDVVLRADETAARLGSTGDQRGADVVARFFAGRAQAARVADLDGVPGAVVMAGEQPRIAISFTIIDDRIAAIDALADPARLAALHLTLT